MCLTRSNPIRHWTPCFDKFKHVPTTDMSLYWHLRSFMEYELPLARPGKVRGDHPTEFPKRREYHSTHRHRRPHCTLPEKVSFIPHLKVKKPKKKLPILPMAPPPAVHQQPKTTRRKLVLPQIPRIRKPVRKYRLLPPPIKPWVESLSTFSIQGTALPPNVLFRPSIFDKKPRVSKSGDCFYLVIPSRSEYHLCEVLDQLFSLLWRTQDHTRLVFSLCPRVSFFDFRYYLTKVFFTFPNPVFINPGQDQLAISMLAGDIESNPGPLHTKSNWKTNSDHVFVPPQKTLSSSKGPQIKLAKYKTVMCRNMLKTGKCPFGYKCTFAHSTQEQRLDRKTVTRLTKTKMCNKLPRCPYGRNCVFAHSRAELKTARSKLRTAKKPPRSEMKSSVAPILQEVGVDPVEIDKLLDAQLDIMYNEVLDFDDPNPPSFNESMANNPLWEMEKTRSVPTLSGSSNFSLLILSGDIESNPGPELSTISDQLSDLIAPIRMIGDIAGVFDSPAEVSDRTFNKAQCEGPVKAINLNFRENEYTNDLAESRLGIPPFSGDIIELLRKPQYFSSFKFSTNDTAGKFMRSVYMCPSNFKADVAGSDGKNLNVCTPLAYWSRLFCHWRGTLIIDFVTFNAAAQQGHLVASFDPCPRFTDGSYNGMSFSAARNTCTTIADLSTVNNINSVSIPFISDTPMKRMYISDDAIGSFANHYHVLDSITGIINVFVANPFVTNSVCVANVVDVFMYVRVGDDFEFFNPIMPECAFIDHWGLLYVYNETITFLAKPTAQLTDVPTLGTDETIADSSKSVHGFTPRIAPAFSTAAPTDERLLEPFIFETFSCNIATAFTFIKRWPLAEIFFEDTNLLPYALSNLNGFLHSTFELTLHMASTPFQAGSFALFWAPSGIPWESDSDFGKLKFYICSITNLDPKIFTCGANKTISLQVPFSHVYYALKKFPSHKHLSRNLGSFVLMSWSQIRTGTYTSTYVSFTASLRLVNPQLCVPTANQIWTFGPGDTDAKADSAVTDDILPISVPLCKFETPREDYLRKGHDNLYQLLQRPTIINTMYNPDYMKSTLRVPSFCGFLHQFIAKAFIFRSGSDLITLNTNASMTDRGTIWASRRFSERTQTDDTNLNLPNFYKPNSIVWFESSGTNADPQTVYDYHSILPICKAQEVTYQLSNTTSFPLQYTWPHQSLDKKKDKPTTQITDEYYYIQDPFYNHSILDLTFSTTSDPKLEGALYHHSADDARLYYPTLLPPIVDYSAHTLDGITKDMYYAEIVASPYNTVTYDDLDEPAKGSTVSSLSNWDLLKLAGDVESNPGPPQGSVFKSFKSFFLKKEATERLIADISVDESLFPDTFVGSLLARIFKKEERVLKLLLKVFQNLLCVLACVYYIIMFCKYILNHSVAVFLSCMLILPFPPIIKKYFEKLLNKVKNLFSSKNTLGTLEQIFYMAGSDESEIIPGLIAGGISLLSMFALSGLSAKTTLSSFLVDARRAFSNKGINDIYAGITKGVKMGLSYAFSGYVNSEEERIIAEISKQDFSMVHALFEENHSLGHFTMDKCFNTCISYREEEWTSAAFLFHLHSRLLNLVPNFGLFNPRTGLGYLVKFQEKVAKTFSELVSKMEYDIDRMEPVGVLLRSEPGIGKSLLASSLLPTAVLGKLKLLKSAKVSSHVYCAPTDSDQKFWDGYHGQPWVSIDDYGSDATGKDHLDIITTISTSPKILNMADLGNKGKMLTSPFICGTTNLASFTGASVTSAITNPDALHRRWSITAQIYVRRDALPLSDFSEALATVTTGTDYLAMLDTRFCYSSYNMSDSSVSNDRRPISHLIDRICAAYTAKQIVHTNLHAPHLDIQTFAGFDDVTFNRYGVVCDYLREYYTNDFKVSESVTREVLKFLDGYAPPKQKCPFDIDVHIMSFKDRCPTTYDDCLFLLWLILNRSAFDTVLCDCKCTAFVCKNRDLIYVCNYRKQFSLMDRIREWTGPLLIVFNLFGVSFLIAGIVMTVKFIIKKVKYLAYDKTEETAKRTAQKHVVYLGGDPHASSIYKNTLLLEMFDGTVYTKIGQVIFLDSRSLLLDYHFIAILDHARKLGKAEFYITPRSKSGTLLPKIYIPVSNNYKLVNMDSQTTDTVVMSLPFPVQNVRDIKSLIPKLTVLRGLLDAHSINVDVCTPDFVVSECPTLAQNPVIINADTSIIKLKRSVLAYGVQFSAQSAWCGLPVCFKYSMCPQMLFGMLCAGDSTDTYYTPIWLEGIINALDALVVHPIHEFESEELPGTVETLGTCDLINTPKYNDLDIMIPQNSQSQKVKSKIYDPELFPDEHAVPPLNVKVLKERCKVYDRSAHLPKSPNFEKVNYAVQTILYCYSKIPITNTDILTEDQVLNDFENSESFNYDTSAGIWSQFNYSFKKKALINVLETDQGNHYSFSDHAREIKHPLFKRSLVEHIDYFEKSLLNHQIPLDFFIGTLKDELRPLQKVREKKTRFFTSGSFSINYLFKKYFGAFAIWFRSNGGFSLMHGIGNDKEAAWSHYYNGLTQNGSCCLMFDFSDFGASIPPVFFDIFVRIVDNFYKDAHDSVGRIIRHGLMTFLRTSPIIVHDFILIPYQGNRDGFYLTDVFNSVSNIAATMMAFAHLHIAKLGYMPQLSKFERVVALLTYGDDSIMNTNNATSSYFDSNTISDFMGKIGLVCTPGDKKDSFSPTYDISEVTFLKSKFVKYKDVVLAPYPRSVIYKQLNWYKKSCVNDILMKANIVNTALRYAAYEGPEFYHEMYVKVMTKLKTCDPAVIEYVYNENFSEILSDISHKQTVYGSYLQEPHIYDILVIETHRGSSSRNEIRDRYLEFLESERRRADVYCSRDMAQFVSFMKTCPFHRYNLVVLMGGDGVLNSYINVHFQLFKFLPHYKLAYIPTGSGNSFGHYFYNEIDYDKLFVYSLKQNHHPINLIAVQAGSEVFYAIDHIICGSSVDCAKISEDTVFKGMFKYFAAGIACISDKPHNFTIDCGEERVVSDLFVSLSQLVAGSNPPLFENLPTYMNVGVLQRKHRFSNIKFGIKFMFGQLNLESFDVKSVKVKGISQIVADGNFVSINSDELFISLIPGGFLL